VDGGLKTLKVTQINSIMSLCIREDLINPDKNDIVPVANEPFYFGLLRYNKSHAALVAATTSTYIKL